MTKKMGIGIVLLTLSLILVFCYFMLNVNIHTEERQLRVRAKKQTEVCAIVFDDMWKIIKKKAQVPDKYKDDFKELILADNSTTYGKDGIKIGGMMNTIIKSNPKFNTDMYEDLMRTIESEMKRFENEQKSLIAISEQHELLLNSFFGVWFLQGVEPIDVKLITSSKTKNAYITGEDNDTDVFKKDTLKK